MPRPGLIRSIIADAIGAAALVVLIWLAYVFLWAVYPPEGQNAPFPFLPADGADADPESHSVPWVDAHKAFRVGVFISEDRK